MSEAPSRSWVAVALCASGVAMFSLMDVLMKSTSLLMGVYSAIVWRSVVGSLFSGTLYAAKGARRPPALVMRLHIYRALLIGPMIWLFFWAFTRLPLAEAIALSFVAPIIALGLTPLMLGEHVGRHSIIAALVGIIGVVVILAGRMGGNYQSGALLGAGAAILSAVFYAVNLVLQRQQAQLASAYEVAFYQNLLVLTLFLPLAPWLLDLSAPVIWSEIIAAAILAVLSQMVLAAAYARASASTLIPLEYSAFLWACLFGWWFFDEALTVPVLTGAALIVMACMIAAREQPQLAAHVEAESA
jgi:S-adenosylmethionine uptake transporter